ncbi:CYTH and CHAD domain-containing protein [Streptomyces sp. B1866]|uniref:CYTH and CHAD domain-containing protein n=1 Tax=Streptomyces sp. B1866 TaxID=3075431 RepID=UPI00288D0809|nr:CYTH and CHAD domain-containing protein [Streptomyces sp. B1866]MDT3397811.1 CYTH and CHAD domain-containing protein [Streptomyces sp. B1866]
MATNTIDLIERERKYDIGGDGPPDLAALGRVGGGARLVGRGTVTLDATYYDTLDQRLAAASATLRRRTGGADAGWHLKLPAGPDAREEIRAPLADALPPRLAALVRSRTRGAELVPVVRVVTERELHHLVDDDGAPLAEIALDRVTGHRLAPAESPAVRWTEVEVELADGARPKLLDQVEARLAALGLRRAPGPGKAARVLERTAAAAQEDSGQEDSGRGAAARADGPATAADLVLDYVRAQAAAIVAYDPVVRLDKPDAVHQMRVATRRLRSTLRAYRPVLDRRVTDPLGEELKWLAGELGAARDSEVTAARLDGRLTGLPGPLRFGAARAALAGWAHARAGTGRRRAVEALDSERYRALLDALDALFADPPLRPKAARPARAAALKAVRRQYDAFARRVETALGTPPGPEQDTALHRARKAAKRTRYTAESARPALGKPARKLARRVKSVQKLLGEHQDSVMAREALRDLAAHARDAEAAFALGVLYGREEAEAGRLRAALPERWRRAAAH